MAFPDGGKGNRHTVSISGNYAYVKMQHNYNDVFAFFTGVLPTLQFVTLGGGGRKLASFALRN